MQGRIARPRRLWDTFLPKGEDGYEADCTQGLPVRADTHADNVYMQRTLEKSGFVRCGRIYTEDGSPRWAYYHKAATQKASPVGEAVRAADG